MVNGIFKHELGKYARDSLTGFEGTITGRCEHITGCNTYCLLPKVDKDGKIRDSYWLDEGRIIIEKKNEVNEIDPDSVAAEKNGAGETPISTRNNPTQ